MTTIRHIVALGRVQGVGYRAFVAEEAMAQGVEGWVRNRRDGTVEAVFAGSAEAVTGVVAACRRGPYGSRVDTVEEREEGADALSMRKPREAFSVLATA